MMKLVRTWYVVYILTTTNDRAHEYPLVISVKGITGAIFKEEIKEFREEMSRTIACVNEVSPRDLTEEITGRYVWIPTFHFGTHGKNNNEVVSIKEYVKPDYSSVENAEKSLDNLLIPDDMMVQTKKDQDDELLQNFCNRFSDQLNGDIGHYGYSKQLQASRPIDPHVLPEGADDKFTTGIASVILSIVINLYLIIIASSGTASNIGRLVIALP